MSSPARALLFFMLILGVPIVLVAIMEGPHRTQSIARPETPFPPDSEILAVLRRRVEQRRSAGIVVGLLEPDGRTRIIAYGDPGPGQPPLDGNSVFEIGSITKVFTATMLAEMVQAGSLKLDDPAGRYLPAGVHLPARDGKQITLAELSEQNSGLPRMPSNMHPANEANPYADYTVEQMYAFLSSYELTRDPGAQFEYSNLGVGLLGNILARHEHTTYESLVRARILDPLGMTHTAITLTPWMRQHLALGHDDSGGVVSGWDLPAFAGAGALRSTALDMLKFLDANLHPERGPLERAMAFAHEPRAPTDSPNLTIGLNWFILRAGADTIVQHNGGTGGYRTFAGIAPRKRIAVVVLTNSGGTGADDVGLHLLSRSIPLSEPPAAPAKHTRVTLATSAMVPFVGSYALTPAFHIDVSLRHDTLFAQATGQDRFPVWPENDSTFFYTAVNAQLTFQRDVRGHITGLVLHQNGLDQRATKVP